MSFVCKAQLVHLLVVEEKTKKHRSNVTAKSNAPVSITNQFLILIKETGQKRVLEGNAQRVR
jgi:formate-dependent nitrite reductase membrane component NrfD